MRRVDANTGAITTIAGNGQPGSGPNQSYSGATGPVTQIAIGYPTSIAITSAGEVYWTTGRVLKVDSAGMLSIVAGNGGADYAGDGGPAVLASFDYPFGLAFDTAGNLFVGEAVTGTVRSIDASTGVIQTVAGTGVKGASSTAAEKRARRVRKLHVQYVGQAAALFRSCLGGGVQQYREKLHAAGDSGPRQLASRG